MATYKLPDALREYAAGELQRIRESELHSRALRGDAATAKENLGRIVTLWIRMRDLPGDPSGYTLIEDGSAVTDGNPSAG